MSENDIFRYQSADALIEQICKIADLDSRSSRIKEEGGISKLIGIFNQTASLVRDSAEPILADVTEAVSIINSLVKRTENNVNKFKNLSSKASKFLLAGLSKATALSGVVAKGLFSLVKSFFKK